MRCKLQSNTMKAKELVINPIGIIPELAVLRRIRKSFRKNDDGSFTDEVIACSYDCVNPEDFSSFIIKVESKEPIISNEEFENHPDVIFVNIPIEEVKIVPYEIKYGTVKLSIKAPYLEIVQN